METAPDGTMSPSASHKDAPEPPKTISYSRLIAREEWEALREVLSSEENCRLAVAAVEECPHIDGGALHFACRFHPPVDVIQALESVFPGWAELPDRMGRFPLHIATKWGAPPNVVKFLSRRYPLAAGLQDTLGKTPLHLACESYAKKYSSQRNEGRPVKEAMVEVIRNLCKAAPHAVNLDDMDGMTALEYAIDNDVNLKAVRSIQKACEKDWKQRRAPGSKHEMARRSLLEQSRQNSQKLAAELRDITEAALEKNMSTLQIGGTKMPPAERVRPRAVKPKKRTSIRALVA